jgi:hypothetical protein
MEKFQQGGKLRIERVQSALHKKSLRALRRFLTQSRKGAKRCRVSTVFFDASWRLCVGIFLLAKAISNTFVQSPNVKVRGC